MLAVIGALVITGFMLYATYGFFGLAYVLSAMGSVKSDRGYIAFWGVVWIGSVILWWFTVGTHIHLSLS